MDRTTARTRRGTARAVVAGIALTSMFALTACTEGGGDDTSLDVDAQSAGAMEDYTADTQFTASEPIDVSMLWTDWPELQVKDSWKVFDEIEKRTNVSIELTHIPFSDAAEKRSLLISAGDAPSVIPLVYSGEDKPFVSSGAVLPMSDYVEHMPNFQKYVEEWGLQEKVDTLAQSDGKTYMMPGLQEVSVPVFSLILRKDIFDEVGAKIPETWDELREGLLKVKAKYPESTPLADGFEGQSMLNYASHAFGARAGWGFGDGMVLDEATGEFEYTAVTDEYKELVTFFHGLVEDGLLDPESFTAADAGGGAKTIAEKIANGSVVAASGASGTVAEFATALDETAGAGNYELVQIAPPGGPAGQIVEPRNFWHGFMLSSDVADSENFLATLQFLDWLYYNPDARELLRWGIEGETYTKDADGTITLSPDVSYDAYKLNPEGTTDLSKDLGFSTFLSESTESRALKESYNSPEFVDYVDSVLETRTPRDPYPPAPLDEAELEQASLSATPLKDTVDTNTLKFILGDRDLAEWDDFVAELEAGGLQSYIELLEGARVRVDEG